MLRSASFIAVLALSCASIAEAQYIETARNAYAEGRFIEAGHLAEQAGTSQGYALASKSLSIHVHYIEEDSNEGKATILHAIELAQAAIDADPDSADAYLQLAYAYGRHADLISKLEAGKLDYGNKTFEAIDAAIRLAPDYSLAHLNLGRWHAGIIGKVGGLIARTMFKARRKHATTAFEQAERLGPASKYMHYSIALGLADLNRGKYRDMIRDRLMQSLEFAPQDAYEQILHDQAQKHLEQLNASGN